MPKRKAQDAAGGDGSEETAPAKRSKTTHDDEAAETAETAVEAAPDHEVEEEAPSSPPLTRQARNQMDEAPALPIVDADVVADAAEGDANAMDADDLDPPGPAEQVDFLFFPVKVSSPCSLF
jgi:hypothetical protein